MKISSFNQLRLAWKTATSFKKGTCNSIQLRNDGDRFFVFSTDGHRFQKSTIALYEHSGENLDIVLTVSSIKSVIALLKPQKVDRPCFIWEDEEYAFVEVFAYGTSFIAKIEKENREYPSWDYFFSGLGEGDDIDLREISRSEVLDDCVRLSANGQDLLFNSKYLADATPGDRTTVRFVTEKNLAYIVSGNLETILMGVEEKC